MSISAPPKPFGTINMVKWIINRFRSNREGEQQSPFMSRSQQIKSWSKANKKMGWGIPESEFEQCPPLPPVSTEDKQWGYTGSALFYGFGDDGDGNADAVLSGKMAWDYARKTLKRSIWHCEYIHFDDPSFIRLRPGAPARGSNPTVCGAGGRPPPCRRWGGAGPGRRPGRTRSRARSGPGR